MRTCHRHSRELSGLAAKADAVTNAARPQGGAPLQTAHAPRNACSTRRRHPLPPAGARRWKRLTPSGHPVALVIRPWRHTLVIKLGARQLASNLVWMMNRRYQMRPGTYSPWSVTYAPAPRAAMHKRGGSAMAVMPVSATQTQPWGALDPAIAALRLGSIIATTAAIVGCASVPQKEAILPPVTTVMPAGGDRSLRVLTQADDATLTPLQIVLDALGGAASKRTAQLDYPTAGALANPSLEHLPAQLQERSRAYLERNRMAHPAARLEVTAGAWRLVGGRGRSTTQFDLIYRATVKAHVADAAGRTTLLVTEHCAPQPRTLPLHQWQYSRFENVRETAAAYIAECSQQVEQRFPEIFKPS